MQRCTHNIAEPKRASHSNLSRTVADLRWRLDQVDQLIAALARYQQLQGRSVSVLKDIGHSRPEVS
ncbi:MAG: hypothetical protein M3Y57_00665 [Acidobacteriota bacterium]|nr:hypothetical protein [Acidobacteriota bacterium]